MVRNRNDRLEPAPGGQGVRLHDQWTSRLHACDVYPLLGRALMHAALKEWPIAMRDDLRIGNDTPEITVIIAFRGSERLPQLRTVLKSIAASSTVSTEVVLVEQGPRSVVGNLPPGVRHIHLAHPDDNVGWYKSWAYNVGAGAARGSILVFHDADICTPSGYLAEAARRLDDPTLQTLALQRFLFHLDEPASADFASCGQAARSGRVEMVRQNWKGGTIVIRRSAFESIGGFDEGFANWGGEDFEFFDRATSIPSVTYGYVPFVHLWHPPQASRAAVLARPVESEALTRRRRLPVDERIQELARRPWGQPSAPSVAAYA